MVQEADVMRTVGAIPDELYNLTQLAEVTLAASKLSTTNLQQIKAYFKHEESEEDDGIVIDDCRKREAFYAAAAAARQGSDSCDSFRMYKLKSQCWTQSNRRTFDSASSSPNSSSSCLSMSDEEADKDGVIYNYSHKIFDRRKSRKIAEQGGLSDELQATESNEAIYGLNHLEDLNSSSEDIHTCPECGKKYSTSSNLARHRQTHRSLEDKKARRCPHCDKVYVSMPAFSMHVRTHNQGCECPHCGKCFSRPWLLQGHIRTHTGEKPFKCSICAKAFADKSNLRAHVQTHSNTKPHCCLRCGKSFALKSYLYKHEESSCLKNEKVERAVPTKREKASGKGSSSETSSSSKAKRVSKREKKTPSYVNMANGVDSGVHMDYSTDFFNPYSRVSVIRTSSIDEDQYQDQPVDFSAKRNVTNESS